ncbi:triacylglycerol lipase-like protein [Cryomyces antarcticus]
MLFSALSLCAVLLGAVTAAPAKPDDDGRRGHGGGRGHGGNRGLGIGTLVDLGYTQYQGVKLAAGVNQYLGLRYAAPPLGDLRFRAPAETVKNGTIQAASQHGPLCYSDCLFIDVYAPSNATQKSKLPVFFWIQGGGYTSNANANYNGTDLVNSSGGNMVVVNFNYRVGPFGFLASEKVRKNGDLNVGLLDQRKALQWVKQYISKFGGDPDRVVVVGASAGAGSIAMHLLAYGGRNDHLFVGAIGESVFFPTQPKVSELEWQFTDFANAAGCSSGDQVACLRSKDSATLQTANSAFPYPGKSAAPLFEYSPCIDGSLLTDYPYKLLEEGKFIHVPIIFGNDENEGSYFAVNASSPEDISTFFMNNYPKLSASDTNAINSQYPLSQYPPAPQHNQCFNAASYAYGETTFNCPGLLVTRTYTQYMQAATTWSYRYNVLDPANAAAGLGTPHTFEVPAVWGTDSNAGGNGGSAYQTTNRPDVPLEPASPQWDVFGQEQRRLLIEGGGRASMESVDAGQKGRCAFWEGLSVTMEQ